MSMLNRFHTLKWQWFSFSPHLAIMINKCLVLNVILRFMRFHFNHYCISFSLFEASDVNLRGFDNPGIIFKISRPLKQSYLFRIFGTPISKQYGPFSNCCGNNHYHLCKDLFMALKVSTSGQPTSRARAQTQYIQYHACEDRETKPLVRRFDGKQQESSSNNYYG